MSDFVTWLMVGATLLLVLTVWIEIWAIMKLRKEILLLQGSISSYFTDTMQKLKPLIEALNRTTPFINVVNSIADLFNHKKIKSVKKK